MPVEQQRAEGSELDGLTRVRQGHAVRLSLCALLEDCADRLPDLPGTALLMQVGSAIAEVSGVHLPRALEFFAALPVHSVPDGEALSKLTAMHNLDSVHGEDLLAALWEAVRRPDAADITAIGYMLRCYFDGSRRAIAFEQLLIATACDAA